MLSINGALASNQRDPRIIFGLLLGAVMLSGAPVLAAEKTIQVEQQHRDEPVLISRVTVGNIEPQSGLVEGVAGFQPVIPFEADDNWLQNTTIYIVNRTDKNIAFARLALAFPETGDGSAQKPIMTYSVTLGRIPQAAAFSGKTGQPLRQPPTAQPLSFAPGQTLAIHLGDYTDQIRGAFSTVPFAAITKCIIRRTVFFFDDGMKWDGAFSVPDPNTPGKWNRMEGRYFPGIPSWPPK